MCPGPSDQSNQTKKKYHFGIMASAAWYVMTRVDGSSVQLASTDLAATAAAADRCPSLISRLARALPLVGARAALPASPFVCRA